MTRPATRPARLDAASTKALVASVPGWELAFDGKSISRRFKFADFDATMAYVNRLAAVANSHDHHPDLKVGYGYCEVLFTTHDADGLTELDATCVRAAQQLADEAAAPRAACKYAWTDVAAEQPNPSMVRRMIHGDRVLVAAMHFKDGFVVPLHQHVHEQVTLVKSGTIRFRLGASREQVIDVCPGEVLVIPSSLPHEAQMIGDVEEMDVFTPLREDWLGGTDDYLRR
jgi:pterin-4a-carbinolamine dehydratase/mannose-6-phosphate isomerase-like protein (cupin superfamily)